VNFVRAGNSRVFRDRAKREQLGGVEVFLPESQGHNLALTVWFVPDCEERRASQPVRGVDNLRGTSSGSNLGVLGAGPQVL